MAKATPKLEQRKDSVTGELKQLNVPILIDFSFNGTRLWLQTGESIDRRNWDGKNHKVKSTATGSIEINAIISIKCEKINKIYRDAILAGKIPTVSYLRNCLNDNDNRDKKTLIQHYDDFIEGYKLKASVGTVKKLTTNKKHLVEFAKKARISLDFEVIDNIFFNKYVEYFLVTLKHTNGTVAKNVKVLKWFLNYCSKLGFNKNYTYKSFSYKSNESEIIALTGDELMKIYNLKIENDCLAQVRDCFCFMCFTALRYGDAREVKRTDIFDDYIKITSLKTRSQVSIPLIDETRELLGRYRNNLGSRAMPFISNQKMNEYLKEVGKLAELNRTISKVRFRGSQRIENTFKLYEVLTCHVGRKTFISYMFNKNVDSELIRSISNHKSISSFARYNQIDEEHKATQMRIAFAK